MNEFKTHLIPLIPIGRLAISIFFCGLTCLLIYGLIDDFKSKGFKEYIVLISGAAILGLLFLMFFNALITTTKSYTITDQTIEESNLLGLRTKTVYKDEIQGFSTSIVPYRIWSFKQIIIYLKDGTKMSIMQFAYFNYKEIKPVLDEKKYNYLGYEPYIWKWPNSRVYKFDERRS